MTHCRDPKQCAKKAFNRERRLFDRLSFAEELLHEFRMNLLEGQGVLLESFHSERRQVDRLYSKRDIRSAIEEGWAIDYSEFEGRIEITVMSYIRVSLGVYRPIHVVCGITNPKLWVIITVKDPSERPWRWDEKYEKKICFCNIEV
ncbi:hypothetical protein [Paenibacillus sp. GYB003]|uniref:hypothetical protein n=1 Tax=Paenibacillus sp. GYB003 TaxID=2994392 RepID=UPI002F96C513